jgi:hypothetical protein
MTARILGPRGHDLQPIASGRAGGRAESPVVGVDLPFETVLG